MIQIKNLRKEKPINPWDVKVDRSSILGNPFYMKNESFRNEVCKKYEDYFLKEVQKEGLFKEEAVRLYDIFIEYNKLNLFCWCAPKRCHAEVIKKYIESIRGR